MRMNQKAVTTAKDQLAVSSVEIAHLSKVVALAAFASEARRVLRGVQELCELDPSLDARLVENIPTKNAWEGYDDMSGEVLQQVADRLAELSGGLDRTGYQLHELAYPSVAIDEGAGGVDR